MKSIAALSFLLIASCSSAWGLGEVWKQHSEAGNGWYWVYPYGFVYPAEDTGWAYVYEYGQWAWSPNGAGEEMWFAVGNKWFWTNLYYYPMTWTNFDGYTRGGVLLVFRPSYYNTETNLGFFTVDKVPEELIGYLSFDIQRSTLDITDNLFSSLSNSGYPSPDPYSVRGWFNSGKEHAEAEARVKAANDLGNNGYQEGRAGIEEDIHVPEAPPRRAISENDFPLYIAYYRYLLAFDYYWKETYFTAYYFGYLENWQRGYDETHEVETPTYDGGDILTGIDGDIVIFPAGG